jgi:hypothetical protein
MKIALKIKGEKGAYFYACRMHAGLRDILPLRCAIAVQCDEETVSPNRRFHHLVINIRSKGNLAQCKGMNVDQSGTRSEEYRMHAHPGLRVAPSIPDTIT